MAVLLLGGCQKPAANAPASARNESPAPAAPAPSSPSSPVSESETSSSRPRLPSPLEETPDSTVIIPEPIPESARLKPCKVVWKRTEYDEETRAPTVTTRTVRRLVRHWPESLRDSEWKTVAPLPLTEAQARAMLPGFEEYGKEAGGGVFAPVGDGTISYRFDGKGRTVRVGWDPSGDSSDYEYRYHYECSPAPSRKDRPQYDGA